MLLVIGVFLFLTLHINGLILKFVVFLQEWIVVFEFFSLLSLQKTSKKTP
jgi:hypothetical protein